MYWRVSKEKFLELDADKRIWWGKDGNSIPQIKRFLSEVKQGVVPQTIWFYKDVGHTQDAKKELLQVVDFPDSESVFITPKPTKLISRILQTASDKDSIIMDSFAGSGTTGHAVMQLNKQDGGNRHFILVELEAEISRKIIVQRMQKICKGYNKSDGTWVEGLGGGFRYCKLGTACFDEQGRITPEVTFADLARHVFFTETGEPIPRQEKANSPLIGIYNGTAVYLLYNGILKDERPGGGNVLTQAVLDELPKHDGPKVIYGTACRFSSSRLKRQNIVFKQIPYEIRVR